MNIQDIINKKAIDGINIEDNMIQTNNTNVKFEESWESDSKEIIGKASLEFYGYLSFISPIAFRNGGLHLLAQPFKLDAFNPSQFSRDKILNMPDYRIMKLLGLKYCSIFLSSNNNCIITITEEKGSGSGIINIGKNMNSKINNFLDNLPNNSVNRTKIESPLIW